ncbi:MAG: undecaprenyl-diphosphate phosphatase [Myxococcota bacterium]
MTIVEALVLGLVQGLTEFLPVSSSGHLVIFETLFGIEGEGGLVFEVAVHVATLLAILVVYRARVAGLARGALARDRDAWAYIAKLALATFPAVVVGLGAKDRIEATFASPAVVGVCLVVTAAILWTTRATLPRARAAEPGFAAALWIGCAQAFAILPGISRSGTTVAAALALGVAPIAAAEFSFLLGTIAIAGAAVLILPDLAGARAELAPIALGSAAALASGVGAIALFLRLLERKTFHAFAYYLVPAGLGFLAYTALRA